MTSLPERAPADPVVLLEGVDRSFGEHRALHDLTMRIDAGSISVLLGPNGAGKTTAIRVITGALGVDSGRVRVFGLDPDDPRQGEEVRRRCGVVSAKPALYDRLSGLDNLRYSAELHGMRWGAATRGRVVEAATRFGIHTSLDAQVGGYSTGMKTRLALARAVLHDPELLLFDEPTSGLDPESSLAVLAMIREMAGDGTTVVMCTHLLLEAEGLAEQVIVMEAGAAIAAGRPAELIRGFWPDDAVRLAAEDPAGLAVVADLPGVRGVRPADDDPTAVDVDVDHLGRIPEIVLALTTRGVRLTRVTPREPSLEELYFAVRRPHLPGREAADDGGVRLAAPGASTRHEYQEVGA